MSHADSTSRYAPTPPHIGEGVRRGHDFSMVERKTMWQVAPTEANTSPEFGDMHDVHAWALPFAGHVIDPIELLTQLTVYLESRPAHSQRVTKGGLSGFIEMDADFWENTEQFDTVMLSRGWWRGGKTTRGRYYCNPDYTHRHPDSDIFSERTERLEFLRRAADIGILDPSDIAPALGLHASSTRSAGHAVTKASHRLGFEWGERRAHGRKRMYRTWATLSEWGYYHRHIARAFGVGQKTVSKAINRTVGDGDRESLPTDPTLEVFK